MAQIWVVSDDERVVLAVFTDPETAWTTARCGRCGAEVTDRGHFEDTIEAAEAHADRC